MNKEIEILDETKAVGTSVLHLQRGVEQLSVQNKDSRTEIENLVRPYLRNYRSNSR